MAFCGFEKDRKTLKYRCPAAVYGLDCKCYRQCHQQHGGQVSDYGRVGRVMLDRNRRIFTPTPRHTTWQKGCNQRTSLERIFSRFDQGYRFERHYIRGKVKMQTRVSIAMAILMAMALAHNRADRKHQMRSLVKTWHLPKAAQPPLDRKRIAAHDVSEAMARLKSEKLPQPPVFTSCSRAFASIRLQLTV